MSKPLTTARSPRIATALRSLRGIGALRIFQPAANQGASELTRGRLKELLHYNPGTGIFTWRVDRPRVKAGDRAGCLRDGYIEIGVDGKRYGAHRLAFLYMEGRMSDKLIDHKNLRTSDNRWCNLREATNSQNQMNTLMKPRNISGFKGVCWHQREKRWRASIRYDGKKIELGYYDTPEKAYAAYCEAAEKHHGEFARVS